VPFHAAETYITRLLSAGKKVAICEQVEDPAKATGLVKRDVVEILTPGTAMTSQLLQAKENNYCLALHSEGTRAGVALIDVSTGDFLVGEDDLEHIQYLLQGKRVREIVRTNAVDESVIAPLGEVIGDPVVTMAAAGLASETAAEEAVNVQFGSGTPGPTDDLRPLERRAAGILLAHCQSLREGAMRQVVGIEKLASIEFMALDEETIRNLELFEPLHGGDTRATLIRLIDKTLTPMGAGRFAPGSRNRSVRRRSSRSGISAVAEVHGDSVLHEAVAGPLREIHDIQRVGARVAARKAIPRELHALKESIEKIPQLRAALAPCRSRQLRLLAGRLNSHEGIAKMIEKAIVTDPPGHLRDGGVIREGYSEDSMVSSARRAPQGLDRGTRTPGETENRHQHLEGRVQQGLRLFHRGVPHASRLDSDGLRRETDSDERGTILHEGPQGTGAAHPRERRAARGVRTEDLRRAVRRGGEELPGFRRRRAPWRRSTRFRSLAAAAKQHRFRRPTIDDSRVLELAGARIPSSSRW